MVTSFIKSNKLLCIVGPTATGKTDVALKLAKIFKGELIACDSRQVYRDLDLGTGKEPGEKIVYSKHRGYWIVDDIKIWMYDVANPAEQYSVSNYINQAKIVIQQVVKESKLPILVGGTGYYLNGLLKGVDTAGFLPNQNLREELNKLNLVDLQKKLQELNPDIFNNLNNSEKNNPRRLLRKIEILLSSKGERVEGIGEMVSVLKIGLTAPREFLSERIEKRVVKRINEGMIEEVRSLAKKGMTYARMKQLGLEYGVIADLLKGDIKSQDELILILQQKIKQYAKRQMTWFKKDPEIVWIDITEKNYQEKVALLAQDWYNA